MMKILFRSALCIALSATLTATAAAQSAPPASQAPSNAWTINVAPYLVAAGLSGTVGVSGYESEVDIPASKVISHLKMAFMGSFGAEKHGWGFGADVLYAKLHSEAITVGSDTVEPTASVGLYTFLASRRLGPVATLVFGARVSRASTTIVVTEPIQERVSGSKTWVDPVVGVNLAVPIGTKAKFSMVADIGGFGTASTISTNLMPAVQFRLARHAWLAVGYRYTYDNYKDDAGFVYKVTIQGPGIGVVIPF